MVLNRILIPIVAASSAFVGLAAGFAIDEPPRREPQCYEDEVAMRVTVPGEWQCVPRDDLIIEIDSRTGEPIGE